MKPILLFSLLHPRVDSPGVGQPPAPDSSGRAKYGDRPRIVEVSTASDVEDSAIQVAESVLGRAIGHEHDVVQAAQSHALIEVDGCRARAEAIGDGGCTRGKAWYHSELHVGWKLVGGDG